jgi:hypothetical protein
MKLFFLLALLSMAAPVHDDDFPTLSDQILWRSEARVCRDYSYDCIGLGRISTRCCQLRVGLI